jgi:hypothetical protein
LASVHFRAIHGAVTWAAFLSTTEDLLAIHGAGGVAWIAQAGGDIVHQNDGTGWVARHAGASVGGIFATSATDVVFSSSAQSTIIRWNGSAFAAEDSGSASPTPVLFQPPGGPMLASGLSGAIVQHP